MVQKRHYWALAYLATIPSMFVLLIVDFLRQFDVTRNFFNKKMKEREGSNVNLTKDQRMCTMEAFNTVASRVYYDLCKSARQGGEAPDTEVMTLDGREAKLLDFMNAGRPLVLNFGSITCSPFMKVIDDFNSIVEKYGEKADFLTVYVSEAHPTDGWFVGSSTEIAQHKNENERIEAAKMLTETADLKCDVVIDFMSNPSAELYGARIDRLYILLDGMVFYQGGSGPYHYDLKELEMKLKAIV